MVDANSKWYDELSKKYPDPLDLAKAIADTEPQMLPSYAYLCGISQGIISDLLEEIRRLKAAIGTT